MSKIDEFEFPAEPATLFFGRIVLSDDNFYDAEIFEADDVEYICCDAFSPKSFRMNGQGRRCYIPVSMDSYWCVRDEETDEELGWFVVGLSREALLSDLYDRHLAICRAIETSHWLGLPLLDYHEFEECDPEIYDISSGERVAIDDDISEIYHSMEA